MFEPKFEVTRVNSMQWNRTVNVEVFSVLDDEKQTRKEIPADVLEKVKSLLRSELAGRASKDLQDAGESKANVSIDLKS